MIISFHTESVLNPKYPHAYNAKPKIRITQAEAILKFLYDNKFSFIFKFYAKIEFILRKIIKYLIKRIILL